MSSDWRCFSATCEGGTRMPGSATHCSNPKCKLARAISGFDVKEKKRGYAQVAGHVKSLPTPGKRKLGSTKQYKASHIASLYDPEESKPADAPKAAKPKAEPKSTAAPPAPKAATPPKPSPKPAAKASSKPAAAKPAPKPATPKTAAPDRAPEPPPKPAMTSAEVDEILSQAPKMPINIRTVEMDKFKSDMDEMD